MVTVLTVLFNGQSESIPVYSRDRYGPHWVDRLYRGFKRHAPGPFRMLVLVDREYEFSEPVEQAELMDPGEGWMAINEAFRPDLGVESGVLVGLDTVITGDLSDIWALEGADIFAPRDPYHLRMPCNALVRFTPEGARYLWDEWNRDRAFWRRECMYQGHPSEMVFLRRLWPRANWEYIDDRLPGQVLSYKVDVRSRGASLEEARVVYFHGNPKPCDLKPSDPVRKLWEAA